MTYETIIVERKAGIGYLTLNRPKVFNAISEQMIREMKKAVEELNQDPTVGVVIITGAGKAFQSGADIQELSRMSPLEILRWNQGIVENLEALEKMRQPVIAAINGYALGGGLELALACTLRVAAESAKMGVPEVKIGILPGAGGTQRLPRLIGKGLAAEIILTGEPIDAREAFRIGLVNRVVPDDQLMATAEAHRRKNSGECSHCGRLGQGRHRSGERSPPGRGHSVCAEELRHLFCDRGYERGNGRLPAEKKTPV